MAIKGTMETQDSAAPGGPSTAAPGPSYGNNDGTKNPLGDIHSLSSLYRSAQPLPANIDAYIEGLKKTFAGDMSSIGASKITCHRLAEPQAAFVFKCDHAGVIMLFEETLTRDLHQSTPASDHIGRAYASMIAQYPEVTHLKVAVIVSPQDYIRINQMAAQISNVLFSATNPNIQALTIGIMTGDYVVDTDVDAVRNFISANNPHSVQPRIDYGFVLMGRPAGKRPANGQNMMEGMEPIVAVGAYTDIISREQDGSFRTAGPTYLPVVHLTSIVPNLHIPGMLPLAVTIAASTFIGQQKWLSPFTKFSKGSMNLGNLMRDPTDQKKLMFFNDMETLAGYLNAGSNTFLGLRPAMVIDVAEGQWRTPSLADWANPDASQRIYDQLSAFFNGRIQMNTSIAPFTILARRFLGVFGDAGVGGRLLDSREIDYLTQVAQGGVQDPSTAQLLQYYNDGGVSNARLLSEKTGGTFRPLYRTSFSLVNQELFSVLAQAIGTMMNIMTTDRQGQQSISTDALTAQLTQWNNVGFSIARQAAPNPGFNGGFTGSIYNV